MFSGRASNPFDQTVEKATAESLTSEPWDLLLTICDKVNLEGESGARNVVNAVQKRFLHRNANVQLYALTLADALVSNCQQPLHREIASASFTESMKRLALDRVSHDRVKKRAASLIRKWSGEFERDPRLGLMNDAYESLRSQGVVFEDEQATTAPPSTSVSRDNELARREEEDIQRAIRESELEAEKQQQQRYSGHGYAPASAIPPQNAPQRQFSGGGTPTPAVPSPNLPGGYPGASTSTDKPLPAPFPDTSVSTSAPVPNRPMMSRAQALYDFEPDPSQPGELPLRKGDIVRVLERAYAEWWRGECRGRIGIFPVNWVQVLPDPTPEQLAQEAQVEAGVFAQIGQVDQLLDLLRAAEERGDVSNVGDDEQITHLYQQCLALRPKILKLIEQHTQKKVELLDINAKFVQAKRGYESMLEESWARHSAAQPDYGPPADYYGGQQPPQPIPYAGPPGQQQPPHSQPYAQHPQHPQYSEQPYPQAQPNPGPDQGRQQQPLPMPGQPDYFAQQSYPQAQPTPGPDPGQQQQPLPMPGQPDYHAQQLSQPAQDYQQYPQPQQYPPTEPPQQAMPLPDPYTSHPAHSMAQPQQQPAPVH